MNEIRQVTITCPHCEQVFTIIRNDDTGALYIPCLHCGGKVATMPLLPPLRVRAERHRYLYMAICAHGGARSPANVFDPIGYLMQAMLVPMAESGDAEAIQLLSECKRVYLADKTVGLRKMRILLDRIERADALLYALMEQ